MAFNSVPTQQRRPLPFLMSDSYSMIKAVGRKGVLIYCMVGRKGVLIYTVLYGLGFHKFLRSLFLTVGQIKMVF